MKVLILIILISFIRIELLKSDEITKENNDLIYNETTIKHLRFLVDSVNLQFKSCNINKQYFSIKQAKCYLIEINQFDKESAIQEILNNISLENLSLKYKDLKIEPDLVFTKQYGLNDDEEKKLFLTNIFDLKYNNSFELEVNDFNENDLVRNTWLPLDDISSEKIHFKANINFLYFTTDFEVIPIPNKYNKYLQYANCVIDTNFTVFEEDAKFIDDEDVPSEITDFLDYWQQLTNDIDKVNKKYEVVRLLNFNMKFKELFDEAIETALEDGVSNDEFEELLINNNLKDIALKLKRKRYVMGNCSMDESPRIHNFEIAKLAAETYNWNIFLRAHLNILNDRVSRASDNSVAWKLRKTYINELEALNINTIDLLLGICLNVSNQSLNQYRGNSGRVARALTESNFQEEFQLKVFEMINDNNLDDLNRIEMIVIYCSYINQINDKNIKNEKLTKFKENTINLSKNYQLFLKQIYNMLKM